MSDEFDDVTPEQIEAVLNQAEQSDARRESKELISFGGLARTESGELTRSNYFQFLKHDLDDYTDIVFTPDEARKVSTHLLKLSTGSTAMTPMYCGGDICPFKERCVFWQMKKAPVGKQCLIEVELMKQWVMDYMTEFDVDPNNFTEVAYVNELAELEILSMRINMNLAKAENAELVTEQTVGVDRDGDPIVQKQVSPFMDLKDRISSRRSKIIKLMVGDRQEKYKKEAALKVKLDSDPSSKMAAMRNQLHKLSRGLDEQEAQQKALSPEDLIDAD